MNNKINKRNDLNKIINSYELFHSPQQDPYAKVNGESLLLSSEKFKRKLSHDYYKLTGKALSKYELEDAINLVAAKALFESNQQEVFYRISANNNQDTVAIDLADNDNNAALINKYRINITNDHNFNFRRNHNTLTYGNVDLNASLKDINLLKDFINLNNENDFKLIVAWLVNAILKFEPQPIMVIEAEQGSGKSTFSELISSLVDPSNNPLRDVPANKKDLVAAARNSYALCFDNMSGTKQELSDQLCRISTGGSFASKKLYTNDDEVAVYLCNPIILNGIDNIATRGDLADRSIIIELYVMESNVRKELTEIRASFEKAKPRILGALFKLARHALAEKDNVQLEHLPRMATFAKIGVSIEAPLCWTKESFKDAYLENIELAALKNTEESAFVVILKDMVGESGEYGTATELFKTFMKRTLDGEYEYFDKSSLPKNPQSFSRFLNRVAPALRRIGINVEKKRFNKVKKIHLTRTQK